MGREHPRQRKLFVLLTKFPGVRSNAVSLIARSYYNHASIGLEEDTDTFYSFVCKGFIVEKITRYLKPDREPFPCLLYELPVSEEAYQSVKELLLDFVEKREGLRYSWLGVALSILRIPYKQEGRYFCSQFVAEVLGRGRAARLKKDSTLYLPRDFAKLQGVQMRFQGNLLHMKEHFARMPCPA